MNRNQSLSLTQYPIQYENRFVCKLFGNRNHDFIEIDKDDKRFIIRKTKINEYEKRGLITNWEFELDHIYNEEITPDEIYENEINCSDFLNGFQEGTKRTIIFVGSSEDTIKKDPFATIIRNSINDFLIPVKENEISQAYTDKIVSMSWCEITQKKVVDLLMTKDRKINYKLSYNEDEICIEGLMQVEINSIEMFDSIIQEFYPNDTLGGGSKGKKQSLHRYNTHNDSCEKKRNVHEQSCQLISIKYYNTMTNTCISKVNFLLYRAYEFNKQNTNVNKLTNSLSLLSLSSSALFDQSSYYLYTKDNYAFFNAINSKLSFRSCSLFKYIEDTYYHGKNLFIINIPIETEYMVLIHDLLNNVRMRKLTCQNFLLNEDNEIDSNNKTSELCFSSLIDNKENDSCYCNSTINETILSTTSKKHNYTSSSNSNSNFNNSKLNIERLKLIKGKMNIMQLFKLIDNRKQRSNLEH